MEPTHVRDRDHRKEVALQEGRYRRRSSRHDAYREHLGERLHSLTDAIRAAGQGDLSVRLPANVGGEDGALGVIAPAFNVLVEKSDLLARDVVRAVRMPGAEGQVSERLTPGPLMGSWGVTVDSVHSLVESMAFPTCEALRILSRVAKGGTEGRLGTQGANAGDWP